MADLLERLASALRDRYELVRELGRGGTGVVFLAHDLKHDRQVALKVLRPEIAHTVTGERFLREIRIAARLQHQNILSLIDSGDAGGLTYYVMPFVPGESLRDRLDREKQLPIDDALQVAREVCDALVYAHGQGFVHRDIKPENILLGAGHALVADFGIAHVLHALGDKLTETGIAVGTPAYMSPEQASGDADVDPRTDVYALGCVLYEMLTGTTPFTGTFQAVLARKARDPVPGLRVVRDTVPAHVEQTVLKALERVPADRFTDARQFADALGGDVRALGAPPSFAGAMRRRWRLVGAAAAMVLVAGAFVLTKNARWRGTASLSGTFAPLTSDPGAEWFPSISADGKWIVYSGQASGNRDIYLQGVGGQVSINLTKDSPDDDDQPAFSRDGERIAFRSSRDGGGIFVMGRTGEGVRRVTNSGFRPTWSADGAQIAFTTENVEINPGNSEGMSGLWIVSANGGAPRELNSGDAILPSWSPHGHRIAFAHRLGTPAQGDIWTISPDGGKPLAVTTDLARDWSPTWSPDGKYIYYSSNRSGSMNLWRIAVNEETGEPRGRPEPVTTPATFLAHPSVGDDGSRIVYVSAQITVNIQRIAFDPVAGTVIGQPVAVTTGTRQWSSPDPSPDGSWVAFYSLTQPEGNLYVAHPDGSALRAVTTDTTTDRVPRWSPDGKWLSFFSNRAGELNVWKVRADGSDLTQLVGVPSAYHAWSPDGTRIAIVTGNSVDGDVLTLIDPELRAATQTLPPLPRSTIGRFLVNSWSNDGARLVGQVGALGAAGRGIAVYSFITKTYEMLADFGEWPVWLPDGRRVLFVANKHDFFVLDSRTKRAQKIFTLDRDVVGPPRLSRDGRWAYFSRRATEGDLWLLTLHGQR